MPVVCPANIASTTSLARRADFQRLRLIQITLVAPIMAQGCLDHYGQGRRRRMSANVAVHSLGKIVWNSNGRSSHEF